MAEAVRVTVELAVVLESEVDPEEWAKEFNKGVKNLVSSLGERFRTTKNALHVEWWRP